MQHTCIKPSCGKTYQDNDVEAYYCPSCVEQKKAIARELDAKHPTVGVQVVSELQAFEASAQKFQTPNGRTITFGRM